MVGQLEAYGALKLFILSGEGKEWGGGGGVEVNKKRGVRERVPGKDGVMVARVNCVYSTSMEKSMSFFSV